MLFFKVLFFDWIAIIWFRPSTRISMMPQISFFVYGDSDMIVKALDITYIRMIAITTPPTLPFPPFGSIPPITQTIIVCSR